MERWASQVNSKQHLPTAQTTSTSPSTIEQSTSTSKQVVPQVQHFHLQQVQPAQVSNPTWSDSVPPAQRPGTEWERPLQQQTNGAQVLQNTQGAPMWQVAVGAGADAHGAAASSPADVTHIQLTEINGRLMVPVATTADGFNWDVSFQELDVSTLKITFTIDGCLPRSAEPWEPYRSLWTFMEPSY